MTTICIGIISLFPDMFRIIINYGVIGRAVKNNLINIKIWNPRNFVYNKTRAVDDRPYGGGPGMVMLLQPLKNAIQEAKNTVGKEAKVLYLSPQGRKLDQIGVRELAKNKKLILVCGRYEGIDERIIQTDIDEEWSIGDYILSGGELPAMVLIDSISRLIPGVLGHKESAIRDSFFNGLLDHPHYTRPVIADGKKVPEVLLSGNHAAIRRWRLKQSLGRTWLRRPDMLKMLNFNKEKMNLLSEFKMENMNVNVV